jgi:hypothetical protein
MKAGSICRCISLVCPNECFGPQAFFIPNGNLYHGMIEVESVFALDSVARKNEISVLIAGIKGGWANWPDLERLRVEGETDIPPFEELAKIAKERLHVKFELPNG